MGGSGGGGTYRITDRELDKLRELAQERLQKSRIDAEVNSFLQGELATINDKDDDEINERLDEIEEALKGEVDDFDRLLFGGSVAKHTYVDGISDIDTLVVLEGAAKELTPEEFRRAFAETLRRTLDMSEVADIKVGNMAVTVRYKDGIEIQLLPSLQEGDSQSISSADGDSWAAINPREFADRLTKLNKAQAGGVVPTVKIAKAILAEQLSENERPSGYHVEALALAAFENYEGPKTPSAMAKHLFESSASNVLKPVRDLTGQSQYVDDALGEANSAGRKRLARELGDIARKMSSVQSLKDWKDLFGK
jgi:Second Messenger Oligonucleotide or Dinucleotide Synthetase domain